MVLCHKPRLLPPPQTFHSLLATTLFIIIHLDRNSVHALICPMMILRTAAWRMATTGPRRRLLSTARWASANNNNNLPTTTFRQGQKIQVEVISFGPLGASVVRS